MQLPILTLDESAYIANRDQVMAYVREKGIDIAPHAKTPMSPDIARDLGDAGAWGTTVADLRQAAVMARAGLNRLILANELGAEAGASHLRSFVAAYPHVEIYVFADSIAGVSALAEAWRAAPGLPSLPVLIDIGTGRTGTRSIQEAVAVADAVQAAGGRLRLGGIGAYEGNTIEADPDRTAVAMDELINRSADMFRWLRSRLGSGPQLILTAGGSLFFDRVVELLAPVVRADSHGRLVLRSGAIFFYDHGICQRFLQGDQCIFVPALRLWANVLSRPEPRLAICSLGMRDISFDQGFPPVLRLHRGGQALPVSPSMPEVMKLNDQHCFLKLAEGTDIAVGDTVEFGVTHACTSIDRHQVIYGIDDQGLVRHAFPTFFG